MIMSFPMLLILLLGAHAYVDFTTQSEVMIKAKNRFVGYPGIPWYMALGAHSLIHGALVSAITGVWWLGLLETGIHFSTDDTKCSNKIGFITDQAIHVICKILWAALTVWLAKPWGSL